jgi:hypothetical protein
MADYYPLLSRAIASLAGKPESDRHAVYARARAALERQLRSFEPALGEEAIHTELDALEATIIRIEAEQTAAVELPAMESGPALPPKETIPETSERVQETLTIHPPRSSDISGGEFAGGCLSRASIA